MKITFMASSKIQTNPTDVELGHSSENRTLEREPASQANNAGSGTFSTPDTGAFASYAAYLNSIVGQRPVYRDLASYFRNGGVVRLDSSVLVLQEIDNTLESHSWNPFSSRSGARFKPYLEDVRIRVVVVYDTATGMLNDVGLHDVDPALFHAAPIHGYEADNIETSLSDSPKIFQLPGKMAVQVLRYRNTAGQEFSVGKFDASIKRSKKCG